MSHEQFTAEQLLAEANRHGGLVADMLTYAATLRQAARVDLPDAIRVPLDEVRADLGYLFGRVAADGSFMQAAIDSCRIKLDKVRAALEAALSARPAMGVAGEVVAMRDAVGACCDGIQTRIAELEAQPAERQGEAIGEVRDNGVTWFRDNPHAFPVGTRFYTHPAAPVGVPEECFRPEVAKWLREAGTDMYADAGADCGPKEWPVIASSLLKLADHLAATPSAPQGVE